MPNGRCRIHGGKSTGAPTGKGNGNYKNGKHTKRHKELKKATQAIKAAIRQNDHAKAHSLIDGLETILEWPAVKIGTREDKERLNGRFFMLKIRQRVRLDFISLNSKNRI